MTVKPLASEATAEATTTADQVDSNTNTRTEEELAQPLPTPLRTNSTVTVGREFVQLEPDDRQLFIKTVTPELSHAALHAHCAQAAGFSHLILSDPNPQKKFYRFGWICFDSAEHIPEAEKVLAESTVDNFTLHLQHNTTAIKLRAMVAPGSANVVDRLRTDLEGVRRVARKFEEEVGDHGGSQAIEARYQASLAKLEENRETNGPERNDEDADQLVSKHARHLNCSGS